MQEQEKQEKVLQLINLYAINKFIKRVNASKMQKLILRGKDGDLEMSILEDIRSLAGQDDFSKN